MPRVEGYAVISRNGMIAHEDGSFPAELKIESDQRFFLSAVAKADAVAHGRNSGPEVKSRKHLILTRKTGSLEAQSPNVILWNPAGASFTAACERLSLADDHVLAVLGGTDAFAAFLKIGFDTFFLSCTKIEILNGRPVFPGTATPQQILSQHALILKDRRPLDDAGKVVLETWVKP